MEKNKRNKRKKDEFRGWGDARLVKHLSHECENLSSNPENPHKKREVCWMWGCRPVILVRERWEDP